MNANQIAQQITAKLTRLITNPFVSILGVLWVVGVLALALTLLSMALPHVVRPVGSIKEFWIWFIGGVYLLRSR